MKTSSSLVVVVLLMACGEPPASHSEDLQNWSVDPLASSLIGEIDGDPHYLFQRIASVRLTTDGRVAVADLGSASIRIFDGSGEFLVEEGREGKGPGEYQYISSLRIGSDGTMEVYDSRLYRLTRLAPDGSLLDTQDFLGEGGNPEIFLGQADTGDFVLGWIEFGTRNPEVVTPDLMKIGRFGVDGRLHEVLVTTAGFRRFGGSPVPFTPSLHAFLTGDSVYFTDGLAGELTGINVQGDSLPSVGIDFTSVAPSEAWRILEEEHAQRGTLETLERFADLSKEEPIPEVSRIVVDDVGRFWMKRYAPATDSHTLGGWAGAPGGDWSIVDVERGHVADVSLPPGFILMDVRGDRVVGVVRDDLGVERVAVHRITR